MVVGVCCSLLNRIPDVAGFVDQPTAG